MTDVGRLAAECATASRTFSQAAAKISDARTGIDSGDAEARSLPHVLRAPLRPVWVDAQGQVAGLDRRLGLLIATLDTTREAFEGLPGTTDVDAIVAALRIAKVSLTSLGADSASCVGTAAAVCESIAGETGSRKGARLDSLMTDAHRLLVSGHKRLAEVLDEEALLLTEMIEPYTDEGVERVAELTQAASAHHAITTLGELVSLGQNLVTKLDLAVDHLGGLAEPVGKAAERARRHGLSDLDTLWQDVQQHTTTAHDEAVSTRDEFAGLVEGAEKIRDLGRLADMHTAHEGLEQRLRSDVVESLHTALTKADQAHDLVPARERTSPAWHLKRRLYDARVALRSADRELDHFIKQNSALVARR